MASHSTLKSLGHDVSGEHQNKMRILKKGRYRVLIILVKKCNIYIFCYT